MLLIMQLQASLHYMRLSRFIIGHIQSEVKLMYLFIYLFSFLARGVGQTWRETEPFYHDKSQPSYLLLASQT